MQYENLINSLNRLIIEKSKKKKWQKRCENRGHCLLSAAAFYSKWSRCMKGGRVFHRYFKRTFCKRRPSFTFLRQKNEIDEKYMLSLVINLQKLVLLKQYL